MSNPTETLAKFNLPNPMEPDAIDKIWSFVESQVNSLKTPKEESGISLLWSKLPTDPELKEMFEQFFEDVSTFLEANPEQAVNAYFHAQELTSKLKAERDYHLASHDNSPKSTMEATKEEIEQLKTICDSLFAMQVMYDNFPKVAKYRTRKDKTNEFLLVWSRLPYGTRTEVTRSPTTKVVTWSIDGIPFTGEPLTKVLHALSTTEDRLTVAKFNKYLEDNNFSFTKPVTGLNINGHVVTSTVS